MLEWVPPWELIRWCQTPTETHFALNPGIATQIAPPDPMRIVLILNGSSGGMNVGITPAGALLGVALVGGGAQMIVNNDWWGPLVTSNWFATGNGNCLVWSVSLAQWPDHYVKPVGESLPPPPAWRKWLQVLRRSQ